MMLTCPKCQSDGKGDPIPETYFTDGPRLYGDLPEDERFFSRHFGLEFPDIYDGVLIWQCADCGHQWPRFEPGSSRYHAAMKIIEEHRAE